MKRLIALSLSLCMAGTMLAACSSSQDTAQEDGPVTITIWHDKEDEGGSCAPGGTGPACT